MKKFLATIVALICWMLNLNDVFAAMIDTDQLSCVKRATANPNYVLTIDCNSSIIVPSPPPPQPPPPAPSDNCAAQGLANTEQALNWGAGNLKFFALDALRAYSFSTGVIGGPLGGTIVTVYGGNQKLLSLSMSKCDFSPALTANHCMTAGNDPVLSYSTSGGAACKLEIGKTYYINIRSAVLDASGVPVQPLRDSCAGACQFAMQY